MYSYASSIEHSLEDQTHVLHVLAAYYDVEKKVSREEFKIFSKKILNIHPGIKVLKWIPEVLDKDRVAYEKSAQKNGIKNFVFTQLDKNSSIVVADKRPVYYPIYFLEPYNGNKQVLGFDISSEQKRLETLLMAKESGEISVSEPLVLVQGPEKEIGVVIYQPIYKDIKDKNSFEGVYSSAVNVGVLIEDVIARITDRPRGINFKVYDKEFPDKIIYEKKSSSPESALYITANQTIKFDGRRWVVEGYASKKFTAQYTTLYPYIIAIVSVLLSVFISMIFYLMQKRYMIMFEANEHMRRFQKLAVGRENRIAELKKENQELKKVQRDDYDR